MTENRVTILDGRASQSRRGLSGRAVLLLAGAAALAVGGLAIFGALDSPDPVPPTQALPAVTTTTTTLSAEVLATREYEADVGLITQLWWDQTTAWTGGFNNGLQFWVDNNYPDMGCRIDDYMDSWFPNGPIEGLHMERTVNSPTIELDNGWLIPGGKLEGVRAKGRVYVMSVRDIVTTPDRDPEPPATRQFHVTILDGQANFFIGCPT